MPAFWYTLCTVASVGFSIYAYVLLWKSILADKSYFPNPVMWLVLTLVDVIIVVVTYLAGHIQYQVLTYAFGAGSICVFATLVRGKPKWNKVDISMFVIAGFAIASWFVGGAKNTILLSLVATTIGIIPFLWELVIDRKSHPFLPFFMFGVGGLWGVLGIQHWDLMNALVPVGFFVLQLINLLLFLPVPLPYRQKI